MLIFCFYLCFAYSISGGSYNYIHLISISATRYSDFRENILWVCWWLATPRRSSIQKDCLALWPQQTLWSELQNCPDLKMQLLHLGTYYNKRKRVKNKEEGIVKLWIPHRNWDWRGSDHFNWKCPNYHQLRGRISHMTDWSGHTIKHSICNRTGYLKLGQPQKVWLIREFPYNGFCCCLRSHIYGDFYCSCLSSAIQGLTHQLLSLKKSLFHSFHVYMFAYTGSQ